MVSPPQPSSPLWGTGAYSLPNVTGEALQGHIIQSQMAQAPKLCEALWKPVKAWQNKTPLILCTKQALNSSRKSQKSQSYPNWYQHVERRRAGTNSDPGSWSRICPVFKTTIPPCTEVTMCPSVQTWLCSTQAYAMWWFKFGSREGYHIIQMPT